MVIRRSKSLTRSDIGRFGFLYGANFASRPLSFDPDFRFLRIMILEPFLEANEPPNPFPFLARLPPVE